MKFELLYIDDDPSEAVRRYVAGRFRVTTCSNHKQMAEILAHTSFPFQVALVDYRLKQTFAPAYENGQDVTKALIQRCPEVEVFGLSKYLGASLDPAGGGIIADWIIAGARWFVDQFAITSPNPSDASLQLMVKCAERVEKIRARRSAPAAVDWGAFPGLRHTVSNVQKFAPLDATVLLRGETGTGKELLAEHIHAQSRRQGPFVIGHCGNLRGELAEVMLHGQEYHHNNPRAAGYPKAGWFEQAAGGTLFLDEIGDLPLDAQSSLLRVLQEKKVRRLLGSDWIPVDFRLVVATHKPIEQLAESGDFRADLYYRLATFVVHVPPLRDRRGDIPALARLFAERYSREFRRAETVQFSPDAIKHIVGRRFPGNVRELQNLVQRVVALAPNARPTVADIREADQPSASPEIRDWQKAPLNTRKEQAEALARWMRENLESAGAPLAFRSKSAFIRAAVEAVAKTSSLASCTPAYAFNRLVQEVDPALHKDVVARFSQRRKKRR